MSLTEAGTSIEVEMLVAPRTDPCERNSRTRLLPRVMTQNALAGKDAPATDTVYIASQNDQIAPMSSCLSGCVDATV